MSTDSLNYANMTKVLHVACVAGATLMAAIALEATKVRAEDASKDLVVRYDQSTLLHLPKPVAEIIIGNPSIVDVTVQSPNLLVITGKTFGMTNIIALDAEKNIIQNQRVLVDRDQHKVVNLVRGTARQTYSCTPNCSPMLTIGDETAYFNMVQAHGAAKTKFSETGSGDAGGGAGGGGQ